MTNFSMDGVQKGKERVWQPVCVVFRMNMVIMTLFDELFITLMLLVANLANTK